MNISMPGSPFGANDVRSINDFRHLESQKDRKIWYEDFQYGFNIVPSAVVPAEFVGGATISFANQDKRACLKVDITTGNPLIIYPHICKNWNEINTLHVEICYKAINVSTSSVNIGFLQHGRAAFAQTNDYYLSMHSAGARLRYFNNKNSADFPNDNRAFNIHTANFVFDSNVIDSINYYIDDVLETEVNDPDDTTLQMYPAIEFFWIDNQTFYIDYIKISGT